MNRTGFKVLITPLLTALLFSGSYAAAKTTTVLLGPFESTLGRYSIALIFLLSLLLSKKFRPEKIKIKDGVLFLFSALLGVIGYHYFFFLSLRYTTVMNTAVINALSPVITAFTAFALRSDDLKKNMLAGMIISFAGIVVLITNGHPFSLSATKINIGDIYMLLSVICWALYSVLIRRVAGLYNNYTITLFTTLIGVILLVPMAGLECYFENAVHFSFDGALSLIYMGVFASGLGYFLYNRSIADNGPSRTSAIVYGTVPLFVTLWGVMLFDEKLSWPLWISIIFVITGVLLLLDLNRRHTPG